MKTRAYDTYQDKMAGSCIIIVLWVNIRIVPIAASFLSLCGIFEI